MSLGFDFPYARTGDPSNALSDWRLNGVGEANTDRGRLYLKLDGSTLELYRDRDLGAGDLVASGPDASPGSRVTFTAQGSSGLSGDAYRQSGDVANLVLWVWLCSDRDLREFDNRVEGMLVSGQTDFALQLRATMREFLTRLASKFPPAHSVGDPNLITPGGEPGRSGEPELYGYDFWTLNNRGAFELTGLQNPGDYRAWAVQQTLAEVYHGQANAGDATDAVFTRGLALQRQADRLWMLVRPWVDIDRNLTPERMPKTRSIRLRRG